MSDTPQQRGPLGPQEEDDEEEELAEAEADWFHGANPLKALVNTFRRFLILDDPGPLYAVLATAIANRLPGEPIWLGLVGPPSTAKTKLLISLSQLDNVHAVSTISSGGALLSATPKKDRGKSKGGLLREIGAFGILLLKDFTSILTLRTELRSEILAAFREIYDGHWVRHTGSDGGTIYEWRGKVGMIFGVTEAYDSHHATINQLGTRFLLMRVHIKDPSLLLPKALEFSSTDPKEIDRELAETVKAVVKLAVVRIPRPLSEGEVGRLNRVTMLAVKLRAAVMRNPQGGREIENVHQAEGTPRMGQGLERLLAGLDVMDLDREEAFQLVERIAMDSVPPLRLRTYNALSSEVPTPTEDVAEILGLPNITARRTLEDLVAIGLVTCRAEDIDENGNPKKGTSFEWKRNDSWQKGLKSNGIH